MYASFQAFGIHIELPSTLGGMTYSDMRHCKPTRASSHQSLSPCTHLAHHVNFNGRKWFLYPLPPFPRHAYRAEAFEV